mgnify:FL=1
MKLFHYLKLLRKGSSNPPSIPPDSVAAPYYGLGTHPDIVARLWDEITVKLPSDCRWIVYGTPALVHPASGIVFGFAVGSHVYALRLPAREKQKALQSGAAQTHTFSDKSVLDAKDIGDDWVFGNWLADEIEWCLAARQFAEKSEPA